MRSFTTQLPMILGSFAAMLVAFIALLNGTSPTSCMVKAGAAFLVLSGFGLILRFALTENQQPDENENNDDAGSNPYTGNLNMIVPGTSVADLLGTSPPPQSDTHDDSEQAAA